MATFITATTATSDRLVTKHKRDPFYHTTENLREFVHPAFLEQMGNLKQYRATWKRYLDAQTAYYNFEATRYVYEPEYLYV